MMDETTKADFISLMQELEGIKIKQSALKQKEENCKADLMEMLKDNGMQKESFEHYGSVRIQTRVEKDYGPEIRNLEIAYKEAKKLADDMGDFQIMNSKESLVYSPPKDIKF
jgi:hypothetical protein